MVRHSSFVIAVLAGVLAFGMGLGLGGCGGGKKPPDPMTPPSLAFVEPPDGQIGLSYGASTTLTVRLARVSATSTVGVAGSEVRFSIFGDPVGSTLSSDRASTDGNGIAAVTLTAGSNESTFSVKVTSPIAETIELFVAVSKNQLVDLDVGLTVPPIAAAPSTVRVLVYMKRTCATLRPSPVPEPALRQLAAPPPAAGKEAVLELRNLLAQSYALVGRADGANGDLLAWSCLDLPVQLLAPGATPKLTLPLEVARATVAGTFALTTQLTPASAELDRLSPWHALVRCPLDPAEALLDATLERLAVDQPTLAATLAGTRLPVDGNGCRPDSPSPDQRWATLLTGGPASALRPVVADLMAIAASAQLTSRLTLATLDKNTLAGTHRLVAIHFATALLTPIDLSFDEVGWATGTVALSATRQGDALDLGPHALVLGLPYLWRVALESSSWHARMPGLATVAGGPLVDAIAAVADDGTATGCAALAASLCDMTADCVPAVTDACLGLGATLGGQLDAALAPPDASDFSPSIVGTLVDSDRDLVVDTIMDGALTAPDGKMGTVLGTLVP